MCRPGLRRSTTKTDVQSIADDCYEIRWDKIFRSNLQHASRRGIRLGSLIGDDPDAIEPLIDVPTARWPPDLIVGVAGIRRGRGRSRSASRVAAAGRSPSTAYRACRGAGRPGRRDRASMRSLSRDAHRTSAGHGGSSAPRCPLDWRRPIWVVTPGANEPPTPAPSRRIRVAYADPVAPRRRKASASVGADWRILADEHCGRMVSAHRPISTPRDSAITEDQMALRDRAVDVPRLVRRGWATEREPLELRDAAKDLRHRRPSDRSGW